MTRSFPDLSRIKESLCEIFYDLLFFIKLFERRYYKGHILFFFIKGIIFYKKKHVFVLKIYKEKKTTAIKEEIRMEKRK